MDSETQNIPQHVPLHLHTEYSLLDGASRVKDIVKKAKASNMPALAITDHGTMYGCLELYREAKKEGIKPIVGSEVYVVNGDHTDRSERKPLYHLILLAKNDEGYVNLSKIVTESHLNGFYYKPRVGKDFLSKHNKGLVAMTACLGGEVPNTMLSNNYEKARDVAEFYKSLYGDDFYLEVQDHGIPEEHYVNPLMAKLSIDLKTKLVATNDSHFTNKSDALAHDSILCLGTNKFVTDFPRMRFTGNEFLKNGSEMMQLFAKQMSEEDIKQSVQTSTLEIAEKIEDYKLLTGSGDRLLKFPVPNGHDGISYLKELVWNGIKERYGGINKEVEDRTNHELNIIIDLGFADYFLIVWDFIKFAQDKKIAVGPGRGSAAGSIVAYALSITDIDPLKYGLLFERFLNPERKSMPDIDTDFCIERRDEVLQYVKDKYGEKNVAQIITFNKLAPRAVLKDIARVLQFPYSESEKIAKMIPVIRGKPRELKWMKENHSEFKKVYETNQEFKQVFDVASKLEGINKTFGVHAAGVVISDSPINEFVPLSKNNEGSIITQYSMDDLAYLGLLKMDFLGLRNLTMINKALDIIENTQNKKIDISKIPLDDEKVYKMISNGDLAGVFQLETSSGMKQVARDLKPSNIDDLSALIALYRPGPLDSGMIDEFIDRKSGKQEVKYLVPELKTILKDTYGSIVYQEQIMQIAQKLANFSLGEADLLRKAMGKKKPKEMAKFRLKFIDGCKANKIEKKISEELFEMMVNFAEYCFNKSHSAAYGMLTYRTAYLKANYPLEYLTALLSSVLQDQDKIKFYMAECKRLGIKIVPPSINHSGVNFTAEPDTNSIRFGMAAIKNVGVQAVNEIIRARSENGQFTSLQHFCSLVDLRAVNKKTIESLIKCGAFDLTGESRKGMIESLESTIASSQKQKEMISNGQMNLFGEEAPQILFSPTTHENDSEVEEFTPQEMQLMEKTLTGFYISSHPFDTISKEVSKIFPNDLSKIKQLPDGTETLFLAILSGINKRLTKTNKLIGILELEDLSSKSEAVIFSDDLIKYGEFLLPEMLLIIQGRVQQRSEGETSIQIKSVHPLEELKVQTIEIPEDIASNGDLYPTIHSIKGILQSGEPSIFAPTIIKTSNNKRFVINNKLWTEPSDVIRSKIADSFPSIRISTKSIC